MLRHIYNRFSTIGNQITESLMKEYSNYTERNFVDRVKLNVQAGNGGKGCVTYYRDRGVRTGAPDGGSGANGGDVIFQATKNKYDLNHLRKPIYYGQNGRNGMKGKRDGKNGGELRIQVPIGTLVYEIIEQQEQTQIKKQSQYSNIQKQLIVDLDWDEKEIVIAKGGRGSKGNGGNIGIRESVLGEAGQFKQILLELKCLADVGLVGYPNAGKSTFLASVSRALPRIAEYPFTTLNPMIGKVKFIDNSFFTIADLPGIIYDAHLDKGLGIDFLRHIERTKMLIFMVDISQEQAKEDPLNQILTPYETIQVLKDEIQHYNKDILKKPQIIIANKCDLDANSTIKFNLLKEKMQGTNCYMISAKHGYNIGQVISACKQIVTEINDKENAQAQSKKLEDMDQQRKRQLLEKEFFG